MTLSVGQKAGWGLADMGIVVFVVVKQLLVLAFLTSFLGVPVQIAGVVTTAILIFDMITDPLVGYLSDKHPTRWGRRAPWIVVGAVVLAVGMVGIFAVPATLAMGATLTWVIVAFGVATVGFTMVAIPYGATAGEMTQDPRERSAMTAWRMGFASLGILIGGAIIPVLAGDSHEGFASAAMMVAPVMVLAIWASVFFTRKAPRIAQAATLHPASMAGLVIRNRAFMILTVLYGVMTLAVALITAGLPFAALYLIMDNGQTALSGAAAALGVLSLMFAAFVLGSIISQAAWVFLSHRLGKTGALMLGLGLYIGLLIALFANLPSTNVTLIAGLFVIAGMTNGAYQQIPWAIYPDLMDVTRKTSGEAIEGAFSAIWLFGQKLANAVAPLILALIIGAYGWQETTQGKVDQTPDAVAALQWSITLVPAAILGAAIVGLALVYRPAARRLLAK